MLLCVAVAGLLACVIVFRPREPRHEGRPIGQWVRELRLAVKVLKASNGTYTVLLPNLSDDELARLKTSSKIRTISSGTIASFYPNWPDQVTLPLHQSLKIDPAIRALQSMGPKALPYLRGGLRSRNSKIKDLFCQWVWPRLPARLRKWIGTPVHPAHRRAKSAHALGLLGAVAQPAVPDLLRLAREDQDDLVRSVALESLHRIDPGVAGEFHPELFEQARTSPPAVGNLKTDSLELVPGKLTL
jgi:hypothetical protein